MRRAAAVGCGLFNAVVQYLVPGIGEAQVAAQLEFMARLAGAEAMSFETIVASGERSSLPHGRATAAKLPTHGFVTLDFGVLLKMGTVPDMTRTVHLGRPASASGTCIIRCWKHSGRRSMRFRLEFAVATSMKLHVRCRPG